ncbi:MAG: FAD:protein FMN transferase [Candidatus Riflebacteria bacterium]|nr:FAD:protein FMN transferase [Candidatus Riflebacteria bacterium]
MSKNLLFVILVAILLFLYLGTFQSSSNTPYRKTIIAMDTYVTTSVYSKDPQAAFDKVFQIFSDVERKVSFFEEKSALSCLNKRHLIKAGEAGFETLKALLEITLSYVKETDGYFDPSFAIYQAAYGFYDQNPRIPADEDIKAIVHLASFQNNVHISEEEIKTERGTLINLGGIAGGFALEECKKALLQKGYENFLIDDAGDIITEGTKPDGSLWKIGVKDPLDENPNSLAAHIVLPGGKAVSTSGSYERFIEVEGKKLNHIFDPMTGRPAESFVSVTVIGDSPIFVDVLSTALFAMPEEKAISFTENSKIAAFFITADGRRIISESAKNYITLPKRQNAQL